MNRVKSWADGRVFHPRSDSGSILQPPQDPLWLTGYSCSAGANMALKSTRSSLVRWRISYLVVPAGCCLGDNITVDAVQKLQPIPDVYQYLATKVGKEEGQYKI